MAPHPLSSRRCLRRRSDGDRQTDLVNAQYEWLLSIFILIIIIRLENVMKELVKDETSTMNTIINEFIRYLEETRVEGDTTVKLALDSGADTVTSTIDEERILFNLEEIRDIVEQIDMARVFAQFGGLECLLRLVEHGRSSMEVRCLAASTIGTLVQNNPTVQDMAFSGGVLDRLNSCFMGSESFLLCSKVRITSRLSLPYRMICFTAMYVSCRVSACCLLIDIIRDVMPRPQP